MGYKFAFVDEFGTNSFNFEKETTHFIVTAILVEPSDLEQVQNEVEKIRKKYFQTGEMKSNKVGSNDKRRVEILTNLLQLNFKIFSVVVDKQKLQGKGFQYKKSFYKYCSGLLYNELYRTIEVKAFADEHGSNPFMKEFEKYLSVRNIKINLFESSSFSFENSKNSVIIQVADIISGTLARIHDTHKKSDSPQVFEDLLKDKILKIKHFPDNAPLLEYAPTQDDDSFNREIATSSISRIEDYINKHTKSKKEEHRDQIAFLELLKVYLRIDLKKPIPTKELIKHLIQNKIKNNTEHYFRSKVIARLRDEDILIASSNKGYKIPVCEKDMYKFINHGNSIIINMLRRIKKAKEGIALATNGKIDILDKPEYKILQNIIEKIEIK